MKNRTVFWAAVCFFSAAVVSSQAKGPDFTGTWLVNAERSGIQEGPRFFAGKLGVIQSDSLFILTRTFDREGEEFSVTDSLVLDGRERDLPGMFNSKRKVTASCLQDTVWIKSVIAFDRDGELFEMTSSEKWLLKDEGKTLSMNVTTVSSWGEMVQDLVYDKTVETKP